MQQYLRSNVQINGGLKKRAGEYSSKLMSANSLQLLTPIVWVGLIWAWVRMFVYIDFPHEILSSI